jgi:hypothetical protein
MAEKMKTWLLVGLMVSCQLDCHKGEAIRIKALILLEIGSQCEAHSCQKHVFGYGILLW